MADPVKKIINNGGFLAALAPVLAISEGVSLKVRIGANRLHTAADTYVKMLATIGVSVKVDADWEGCEQAQEIISWITGPAQTIADEKPRVDKLTQWTADTWAAIADLANGKVPT
jgi:hypothetical protein